MHGHAREADPINTYVFFLIKRARGLYLFMNGFSFDGKLESSGLETICLFILKTVKFGV